mgnify:CR=1 FL=1
MMCTFVNDSNVAYAAGIDSERESRIIIQTISGTSMQPAFNASSNRNKYKLKIAKYNDISEIQRGDIVIFFADDTVNVKRVIGLPNELVEIKDDNRIYINHQLLL